MSLWIRSQDRTKLIEVKGLSIVGPENESEPFFIFANGVEVGKYKNKDVTIRVLDQIEKFMGITFNESGNYEKLDISLKSEILTQIRRVYEMPKNEDGGN